MLLNLDRENARVINQNVAMMHTEMSELLTVESFGGTGGKFLNYSASGANFYYNLETGEIIEFTVKVNDKTNGSGLFKVILDTSRKRMPVVDFWMEAHSKDCHRDKPSKRAIQNIIQSIIDYNNQYGFQTKEQKPGLKKIDCGNKCKEETIINKHLFNRISTLLL